MLFAYYAIFPSFHENFAGFCQDIPIFLVLKKGKARAHFEHGLFPSGLW